MDLAVIDYLKLVQWMSWSKNSLTMSLGFDFEMNDLITDWKSNYEFLKNERKIDFRNRFNK